MYLNPEIHRGRDSKWFVQWNGFKAAYGQVYCLFGIVQSRSRETLKSKYPIGYLMLIITAKYRVSVNGTIKQTGFTGHPYATTRTRTYTKGEKVGRAGAGDARIDKARTDKDVIHHKSKHRSTKTRDIRIFDQKEKKKKKKKKEEKREDKSIGVNRVEVVVASHTLFDTKNQSIYIINRIYTYPYICVYIQLDTCESKYTYARIESACTYV